jgi:peptidoglycan hydrolase CwlO-like protein
MFALFYSKNKINFLLIGFFTLSLLLGSVFLISRPSVLNAAVDVDAREAELRAELKKIEAEQAALQKSLDAQKGQTATIQRDVNVLTSQIKQAELNIKKKKLEIEGLSKEIRLKDETVNELNAKVVRSQDALAELVKKTNDQDNYSLPEILLGSQNLSDFFVDLDSYNALQKQLESLFQEIRSLKGETEAEKLTLEQKQKAELDKKKEIEASKNTVASKKTEKDTLLNASKQTEAGYQQVLKEKQAKAATIRAALFQLRDTQGIQFGDAVKFAEEASRTTGVRAAFILGILKQETNIGQNTGSCIITDLDSGQTQSTNSGNTFSNGIHPVRDLPALKSILDNLGKDPMTTKVSCPQSVGYGGAMGPSQFIPSTWQLYIPRLQQAFGVYPNPWNPEHAITASGFLLKDLGAAAGGYSAEFEAAGRYYAGGNWQIYGKGYATSVLSYAADMQKQIDFLKDADN